MTDDDGRSRFEGPRVILGLYVAIVGFAGFAGFAVARFAPVDPAPIDLLFVIRVPPTPLGLALFGMTVVAIGLGVPLALVVLLSRRLETA